MTVLADLALFAEWHVLSGDIDPAYPVLSELANAGHLGDTNADLVDFLLTYVAFYDLGSACAALWHNLWRPATGVHPSAAADLLHLPTGTERRGHRSPSSLARHLDDLTARHHGYGTLANWLSTGLTDDPEQSWHAVGALLRSVHGNGRWAAYKTCELLATVAGWPLTATDAGHDFSTGPRQGLAIVAPATAAITGSRPADVARLDRITDELGSILADEHGVSLPIEQLETVLCDFHALADGRYYVGHDIDMMLEQVAGHRALTYDDRGRLLDARANVFNPFWLGEANGWAGVRRQLKPLYRNHGVITYWESS